MHINYFGKRGCFFQFLSTNKLENLPKGYSQILDSSSANGIIFPMDDVEMSNNVKFENMSNYSKDKAKRVSKLYVFSLRQVSSTPKYTFFEEMSF